ncbi:MAG: alpha-glucosidase C-terminal domain-containing protein [Deinococcales bacterium]|nr:alpha-glucosidase C-terminal domain-containing protein [Chitinophagaceae bacterium]
MVKLRKCNKILIYGKYELLDKKNSDVYAYTRELRNDANGFGKKWLIVLNFSKKNIKFDTRKLVSYNGNQLMQSNYAVKKNVSQQILPLKPYEARVYKLSY